MAELFWKDMVTFGIIFCKSTIISSKVRFLIFRFHFVEVFHCVNAVVLFVSV